MTTKAVTHSEVIFRHVASISSAMRPSRVASNQDAKAVRRVPMFVPADQVYYWSRLWQEGEVETRANLEVGNARTFDDPLDAIRHLLSDDC